MLPLAAQNNNPDENDIYELSPFEVNTTRDVGYLATNTLAGTRLNSELITTPASISVLTAEFMQDVGVQDTIEAIEYSVTFAPDTTSTNGNNFQAFDLDVRARGFPGSTFGSRDFFRWFIRSDTYNTTRFTFSRGPNSILFGLGDPGGIVNSITKRAQFDQFREIEFGVDEFGSYRAAADINQEIIENKLALRINLLKEDERTFRDNEYENQIRSHIAATFRPFKSTTIRADFEVGEMDRLIQRRWVIRDGFSGWINNGSVVHDLNDFRNDDGSFDFNAAGNFIRTKGVTYNSADTPVIIDNGDDSGRQMINARYSAWTNGDSEKLQEFDLFPKDSGMAGPVNTSDYDFHTYSVFLEQKVLENLIFELAYNKQSDQRERADLIGHQQIRAHIDITEILPDGSPNPNFMRYFMQGQPQYVPTARDGDTYRATVSYEIDTGKNWLGRHRLAGLYQVEDIENEFRRYRYVNTTPLNPSRNRVGQNRLNTRTYVRAGNMPGANGFQVDSWKYPGEPFDLRNPATGEVVGRVTPEWVQDRDRPQTEKTTSVMVAGQSLFWDDKFAVTYGYREDELEQQTFIETTASAEYAAETGILRDTLLSTMLAPAETFEGETVTYGAVLRPLNWLIFSANYSENFRPQTALDLFNNNIGNIEGQGEDYSVRLNLLDGRVYATFTYFSTQAVNAAQNAFFEFTRINEIWETLRVNEIVSNPTFVVEGANDSTSFEASGFEMELIANPTNNLSLLFNMASFDNELNEVNPALLRYLDVHLPTWSPHRDLQITDNVSETIGSRIDQLVTSNETDQLQVGRQSEGHVPFRLNFFAKYTFREGFMDGFDIGFGGRYRSGQFLGYYNTATQGVVAARGVSYWNYDMKMGYKRNLFNEKVRMTLRLNIKNLLDEDGLIFTESDENGVADDYVLQPPREISLSASFDF